MIFIANARGDIQADLAPYAVNQGSDNANQIVFAAPMPENATVSVIFKLPNGVVTLPYLLTNIAQVQGIFDDKGAAYRCWSAEIDYPITEISGSVTAQFVIAYAATGGKPAVRHTTATVFTVNNGITFEPDPPSETDWERFVEQIESSIATANTNSTNAFSRSTQAKETANEAKDIAEGIDAKAQEAVETADEAKQIAESARDELFAGFNMKNGEGVASVVLKNVSTEIDPTEPNIATGTNASAFGDGTIAEGFRSFTEGFKTKALGHNSHAEGAETVASGLYAHSEGQATTASASSAHAEGVRTKATAPQSHTEGSDTIASSSSAHAEGITTQATNEGAHSEGRGSIASGDSSHAEGRLTNATGNFSHTEGSHTNSKKQFAHAEGYQNNANGEASHVEGAYTTANGSYSHAEGYGTTAGYRAHAEGYNTQATGNQSHAEGEGTVASRDNQHAEGRYNAYSTYAFHIIGDGTSDTDRHNLYEVGKDTTGRYIKLGDKKVYESEFNEGGGGSSNLNLENGTGTGSVASKGGNGNAVSGEFSYAFGEDNKVHAPYSFAIGNNNAIDMGGGFAGGANNIVVSYSSFVYGENLKSYDSTGQMIFGTWNKTNPNAKFILGNGTQASPSNLFEVGTDNNGVDYIALGGEVYRKDMLSRLIAKKKLRQVTEYVAGFANGGKLMVALDGAMVPVITYNYSTGKIRIEIAVTNPSNLDVFSDAPSALNAAGLPWGYTGTQITLDPGTSVYFGVSPVLISTRGNGEAGEQMYATYEVSALYESIGGSTELQYTETTELFIRNSDEIYFEF